MFVAGLLASSSIALGAANCQSKVVGKSYDCTFKFSDNPTASVCAKFETGGVSPHFDMLFLIADLGCTCLTTGPFTAPSFNASPNAFACVGNGVQYTEKVKGKKLSGRGTEAIGDSIIISCTQRSTACP
jgi:hypothetical protein